MKRKFFVGVCVVFMAVYAAAQSVTFDLVCENLAKHPNRKFYAGKNNKGGKPLAQVERNFYIQP